MKFGAQVYTIRNFCKTPEDFAVSMKKLADIGYEYVQISGIGPIPAQEVADICKANNLKIILTHTNPTKIKDDTATVIAEHKIMGATYVGIGAMPGDYRKDADAVRQFITDFTPAAKMLEDAGMKLMYHNHDFEFEKIEGKLLLDYLVDEFPQIGFTIDTYWVQAGGADPAAWLEKLAGRIDTIHYKDFVWRRGAEDKRYMGVVMEGNLNWPAIFAASQKAGAKYAFVEQDNCYGEDPFDCLTRSLNNLKEAFK